VLLISVTLPHEQLTTHSQKHSNIIHLNAFPIGSTVVQNITVIEFCLSVHIICYALFQEDTYEAGIANDMRELEMRLESELEEQEKRWSSEEESGRK
jgi:hypothetical protein